MKMEPKICILFISLLFLFSSTIHSQNNKFGTVEVLKKIRDTDKWQISTLIHWKQFYEVDGWRRFGVDFTAKRKLGIWAIKGGMATNYTFDETISNFWEVRPWVGVELTNKIAKNLSFDQFFRSEVRYLIFTNDISNKITTRLRYRIRPTFLFPNKNGASRWGTYVNYEWYFLPNEDLGTRFINSREFKVSIFREFANKNRLYLTYTRERYNRTFRPNATDGNTVGILFSF